MKPRPTFFLNVKLWLHSDVYLGYFFLEPEDIKSVSVGAIWNLAKQQGSHELIWGRKGPPIKT
jgi:hypothetical protein